MSQGWLLNEIVKDVARHGVRSACKWYMKRTNCCLTGGLGLHTVQIMISGITFTHSAFWWWRWQQRRGV